MAASTTDDKPKRIQQVYTLLVEVGRKAGDGLPEGATGAALMCYASGVDEAEAVRETVAILKQADLKPRGLAGYGRLVQWLANGRNISSKVQVPTARIFAKNLTDQRRMCASSRVPCCRAAGQDRTMTKPQDIDGFLAGVIHDKSEILLALREIIRTAAPGLQEHIKWNAPSYQAGGDDRITFNLSQVDAVQVIFHRGATAKDTRTGNRMIADSSGLLRWATDQRAILRVVTLEQVKAQRGWLANFVPLWVSACVAAAPAQPVSD